MASINTFSNPLISISSTKWLQNDPHSYPVNNTIPGWWWCVQAGQTQLQNDHHSYKMTIRAMVQEYSLNNVHQHMARLKNMNSMHWTGQFYAHG